MSTHIQVLSFFFGATTNGETQGVGPSTFSMIPCFSRSSIHLLSHVDWDAARWLGNWWHRLAHIDSVYSYTVFSSAFSAFSFFQISGVCQLFLSVSAFQFFFLVFHFSFSRFPSYIILFLYVDIHVSRSHYDLRKLILMHI